jgi:hypothetical protein
MPIISGGQTIIGGVVSTMFTVDEQVDESPLLLVTVRVILQLTPVDSELSVRVGVALVALLKEPPGQSVLHE